MSLSNLSDQLISAIIAAIVSFTVTFAGVWSKQQVILERLDTISTDVRQIKNDFYRPYRNEKAD